MATPSAMCIFVASPRVIELLYIARTGYTVRSDAHSVGGGGEATKGWGAHLRRYVEQMAAHNKCQVWATCAAEPAVLRMYLDAGYNVEFSASTAFLEDGAAEFQLVLHPCIGDGAASRSRQLTTTASAGEAAHSPKLPRPQPQPQPQPQPLPVPQPQPKCRHLQHEGQAPRAARARDA